MLDLDCAYSKVRGKPGHVYVPWLTHDQPRPFGQRKSVRADRLDFGISSSAANAEKLTNSETCIPPSCKKVRQCPDGDPSFHRDRHCIGVNLHGEGWVLTFPQGPCDLPHVEETAVVNSTSRSYAIHDVVPAT
jgi:hypothetical protein